VGQGTGFAVSFDTDYGTTRSLYCLAVLMKQDRIWPHLGGFGAARVDGRPTNELHRSASILMVPTWVALAVLMPLPGVRIVRLLRRRRRGSSGLCPNCGYDLRATPGRCPECGMKAGGLE
jgi:hypothetical protein